MWLLLACAGLLMLSMIVDAILEFKHCFYINFNGYNHTHGIHEFIMYHNCGCASFFLENTVLFWVMWWSILIVSHNMRYYKSGFTEFRGRKTHWAITEECRTDCSVNTQMAIFCGSHQLIQSARETKMIHCLSDSVYLHTSTSYVIW